MGNYTRRSNTRRVTTRVAIAVSIVSAAAMGAMASGSTAPPRRAIPDGETSFDVRPSAPAPPLRVRSALPSAIGAWSKPIVDTTGVNGVHAVLLDTGRVLLWGPHNVTAPDGTVEIQTMASVFDPATGRFRRVDPPEDDNVFCGGATVLGDGTVLVVGGRVYDGPDHTGMPIVLLFDAATETWTEAPKMAAGRWYPTATELADGSAVVVGGLDESAAANDTVEHIGPLLSTTPQVVGTMTLDVEQARYPNEFLLPNGHVFTFAGRATSFMDPSTWRIDDGPLPLGPQFDYPNAVPLPITPGGHVRVVVYGGKDRLEGTGTQLSERIDLSNATPTFTAMTPMPQPRSNMNSVLLPNGMILVVGGNKVSKFGTPYFQSLRYNPATDTWTPMASQALRRAYHSTALLLPDGRVLSAGDNGPAPGGRNRIEIYSPPYVFRGQRPAIVSAPNTAARGTTIAVATNEPIRKVVLIAPTATTHATNMHQRMVQLATTRLASRSANGLTASVPADGTVPPGPYMLFALDSNGIPSVATWMTVT